MKTLIIRLVILLTLLTVNSAWAKNIADGAMKGENKAYIRADGLACYFCAYGLERFFRKSGKVAAYDMKMKEGVVEIVFIKGKPLLNESELNQIVYDAGYTPNSTNYKLTGNISKEKDGRFSFNITENGEKLTLKPNALFKSRKAGIIGKNITVYAVAKDPKKKPMSIELVKIISDVK